MAPVSKCLWSPKLITGLQMWHCQCCVECKSQLFQSAGSTSANEVQEIVCFLCFRGSVAGICLVCLPWRPNRCFSVKLPSGQLDGLAWSCSFPGTRLWISCCKTCQVYLWSVFFQSAEVFLKDSTTLWFIIRFSKFCTVFKLASGYTLSHYVQFFDPSNLTSFQSFFI